MVASVARPGSADGAAPISLAAARPGFESAPDPAALHKLLLGMLRDFRQSADVDPFGNPISRMALELTRLVDKGELAPASLDRLVQHMTAAAFEGRAARLAAYVGDTDPAANTEKLRAVIARVAQPDPVQPPIAFAQFQAVVEALHYGIVFTAHPTFSTSRETSRALAARAAGRETPPAALSPDGVAHRPPKVTLDLEFAWAMEAIGHAQDALARLHDIVLQVAAEIYPAEWRALKPRLVSIASWVGYDHDGRADIGWTDTLRMRLRVKQAQLLRLRALCKSLHEAHPHSRAAPTLELVDSVLTLAAKQVEFQIEAANSQAGTPADRAELFARRLVEGRDHALTDTTRCVQLLTRAVEAEQDPALAREIAGLRAALAAHGLGQAHTHFRLNATQLHNAIRRQIGLDTSPADPSRRRSYINAINELLARVEPVSINTGSLIAERASAKRMFMMIAQLAKHIDAETPIRFLIAETETAFTLLVALYFARLFGVEHLVEISPLFETEDALEHGEAVIDEALRSPHYRAYIERTGRLCVQFGYSDSGRYIGQMAATYWIERLHFKIGAVLARHGLSGIQVVLFDTHGESVGRGGHPVSLTDRLHYIAPPASRAAFAKAGLAVKQESSFQGGDGYLNFLAPEIAFASLSRIVEAMLSPDKAGAEDPIYAQGDFAAEFFAVVRQEFSHLVDDPNYAALLGAFGTNMLDRTGSRPVQRQHEWVATQEYAHPSQLRAIPNNAVLQQLGLLANTVSGLGRATAKDPEQFRAMLRDSPRFRRAMAMVVFALSLSDLDVLRAYVDTLDPGVWLNRSGRTRIPARRDELRVIVRHLERNDIHARLVKVYRRLQADYLLLRDQLAGAEAGELLAQAIPTERREDLALLHALRIALIHRIYLLASHIPDFTPQRGFTRDDLLQCLIHLDVDEVVSLLQEIFPLRDASETEGHDFAEPASYRGGAGQTYEVEHERIFNPIAANFTLLRRIGAAITYHIGAVG